MLSLFKIHNFKSILDLTLDFSYNEGRAPNNWDSMEKFPFLYLDKNDTKNRFIPTLALFGANASGKSNIIEAISVLGNFLSLFNPYIFDLSNLFYPNKLNPKFDTSSFELHFFVNKEKYEYFIEYNDKQIFVEKLIKNNKTVFFIDKDNFELDNSITGTYDKKTFKDFFDIQLCKNKEQIKPFLLYTSKQFSGIEILSDVFKVLDNILVVKTTDFLQKTKLIDKVDSISEILSIIKKFDFDILDIVKKNFQEGTQFNEKEGKTYEIKTIHKDVYDRNIEMDLRQEESLGTNILFDLIKWILRILKRGGIIFVDELDKSLHPLILIKIIEMFKDKDYNKNNAQLVFTSHCTDILEDEVLKRCEVAIVNKNLEKGTSIKRVSELGDITYNIRKDYLAGFLRGIPYPYI